MMTKITSWVFLWVCCSVWPTVMLEKTLVDMSGQGCYEAGELEIKDDQVITVYANYQPNQKPSLDHCDVGIRAADNNRRLEYLVDKLTIFDCGVSIWIYDNPRLVSQPTRKITCSDDKNLPLEGKTSHEVIKISLLKESTQAQAFEFQIHIKTDYGPPFEFERDSSNFYEDPLDTGAIVGIVIAGSVFIIAVAGLSIYCCLKARMNNQRKYAEASDDQSAPSVYTTGTSRVLYQPTANHSSQRGGHSRSTSQDSSEKVSSKHKANVDSNDFHPPSKGINSHTSYKDDLYSNKTNRVHRNEPYEKQERLDRQGSLRGSQKRRQPNASVDDTDYTHVKGSHISRRDSSRGSRNRVKYDKKKHYSRNDDYSSIGKGKKQPANRHWRSRSRSPSQASVGSTVDSNALVYGYSHAAAAHPNTVQDSHPRSRSGSRSRSRTRAGTQRSGTGSRTGSVGRSDGRGRSDVRDGQRTVPKNSRQYGDMSDFLPEQQSGHRSRSRSASAGRSHRH